MSASIKSYKRIYWRRSWSVTRPPSQYRYLFLPQCADYLTGYTGHIDEVEVPAGGSHERLRHYNQSDIPWETRWHGRPRPDTPLILLGAKVSLRLCGRLQRPAPSLPSTMATSVHPSLILQHLQLPCSTSPDNQSLASLPGQWRHPAALNTFIFPPGRLRLPDRRSWDGAIKMEGDRTMGEEDWDRKAQWFGERVEKRSNRLHCRKKKMKSRRSKINMKGEKRQRSCFYQPL